MNYLNDGVGYVAADWLLIVASVLATVCQLAALRQPDLVESLVVDAVRRIKVCAWGLLTVGWVYDIVRVGDLPVSIVSVAALTMIAFADGAGALSRLMNGAHPAVTQPGELDESKA